MSTFNGSGWAWLCITDYIIDYSFLFTLVPSHSASSFSKENVTISFQISKVALNYVFLNKREEKVIFPWFVDFNLSLTTYLHIK